MLNIHFFPLYECWSWHCPRRGQLSTSNEFYVHYSNSHTKNAYSNSLEFDLCVLFLSPCKWRKASLFLFCLNWFSSFFRSISLKYSITSWLQTVLLKMYLFCSFFLCMKSRIWFLRNAWSTFMGQNNIHKWAQHRLSLNFKPLCLCSCVSSKLGYLFSAAYLMTLARLFSFNVHA